jgi:hypothetical protein
MAEGDIYILFNRAFQNDHYKIGMTTKAPEDRARELSAATGIPRAFEVLYEQRVIDCKQAERLLHDRLRRYRSAGNREFFQIPLKEAIKALEGVADEIGRLESTTDGSLEASHADGKLLVRSSSGEIAVNLVPQRRRGNISKATAAVVTFEDHASYTDAVRRPLLIDLRNRVLRFDDRLPAAERCTRGQRIAYSIPGGRVFLEVKVQRAAMSCIW